MISLLYLGHGLVAALLLGVGRGRGGDALVRIVSAVGVALSAVTVLARTSDEAWRSTVLSSAPGAIAGIATACAWLLVGTLDLGPMRWRAAALVGVASTGLVLFATNLWLVPAILFWSCSSIAIAALITDRRRGSVVWLSLVVSDIAFGAGMIGHALASDAWRLPAPANGWQLWAIAGAAIVRAGAVARVGTWELLGSEGAPAVPLLVGGAFAIVAGPAASARPWLGVGLVAAAFVWAVWATIARSLYVTTVAAWPVCLALGAAFVAPRVAAGAGVAAILGVSAMALWPAAAGRAGVERALIVAFVPLTIGFGVILAAATTAFARATEQGDPVGPLAWAAVAALLPAAFAAGVILATRIGRQPRTDEFSAPAVLATWGLTTISIGFGLAPRLATGLGGYSLGAIGSEIGLYIVALCLGAGAAWFVVARTRQGAAAAPTGDRLEVGVLTLPPSNASIVSWGAAAGAAGLASAVAWITIEGLRVGFL